MFWSAERSAAAVAQQEYRLDIVIGFSLYISYYSQANNLIVMAVYHRNNVPWLIHVCPYAWNSTVPTLYSNYRLIDKAIFFADINNK